MLNVEKIFLAHHTHQCDTSKNHFRPNDNSQTTLPVIRFAALWDKIFLYMLASY